MKNKNCCTKGADVKLRTKTMKFPHFVAQYNMFLQINNKCGMGMKLWTRCGPVTPYGNIYLGQH